jgi:hypothetical protein
VCRIFFLSILSASTPAYGPKIKNAVTLKVNAADRMAAECFPPNWKASKAIPAYVKASPNKLIACER